MAPYMQTLARTAEFKRIRFVRVDIEQVPAVAERCNVKALPTYQLYKNGEKLEEMSGALPSKLVTMLKEHNVKASGGGVLKVLGVVLGIAGALFGVITLKHAVERGELKEAEEKKAREAAELARARKESEERRRRRARALGGVEEEEEEEEEEEGEEEEEEDEDDFFDDDE